MNKKKRQIWGVRGKDRLILPINHGSGIPMVSGNKTVNYTTSHVIFDNLIETYF